MGYAEQMPITFALQPDINLCGGQPGVLMTLKSLRILATYAAEW